MKILFDNMFLIFVALSITISITNADDVDQHTGAHILFYYPPNRQITAGFMRQMKYDIALITGVADAKHAKMLVHDDKARDLVESQAIAASVTDLIVNDSCLKYQKEINDPCVVIVYDDLRDMCKVMYTCKVVDPGDGQKSGAKQEAQERHFKVFNENQQKPLRYED